MSLDTWMLEFYLIPASYKIASEVDCIKHSLKKWEGALPKNCVKHNVSYAFYKLFRDAGEPFQFSAESCSLCVKYYGVTTVESEEEATHRCGACPIVKVTGKPCDKDDHVDENGDEIDDTWSRSSDDPQPMIDLLRRVLKETEAK